MYSEARVEFFLLDWGSGAQKIDVAIATDNYPDIIYENEPAIKKYASIGALEPIDSFLSESDMNDFGGRLEYGRVGNQHYMIPYNTYAGTLHINRRIFREFGIDHLIPTDGSRSWTYDQFLAAAKAATRDIDGDGIIDVHGFGIHYGDSKGGYFRTNIMWNFGASLFNDQGTRAVINSQEGIKGLQFLLDLDKEHNVIPPGVIAYTRGQIRDLFLNGKVAMLPDTTGIKVAMDEAIRNEDIKSDEIELWPVQMPHAPNCPAYNYAGGGGYAVLKQKDQRKRELAMKFAMYLADEENIKAATMIGDFPARESAASSSYEGQAYELYMLKLTANAHPDLSHPLYFDVRDTIETPIIQGVVANQLTVEAGMAQIESEINALLRRHDLYE